MSDHGAPSASRGQFAASSRLQLPPGPWATLLDGLCARFPAIDRARWLDRFDRGRVLAADGSTLAAGMPYRAGLEIRYFREVMDEKPVAAIETLLHADAHLVVADKPHFLPVMPAGRFVEHTLLTRLMQRLGNPDLVPLHRLDRDTAGLVMFSGRPDSRAMYHALFREHAVHKIYEAIAAPLLGIAFPLVHGSRIVRGEPFFRMHETDVGEPNAFTRIEVLQRGAQRWRYALQPITGRKHQLRVHMAALGAPIDNDRWYPTPCDPRQDDVTQPLQLLARSLSFDDPLTGTPRHFDSRLALDAIA